MFLPKDSRVHHKPVKSHVGICPFKNASSKRLWLEQALSPRHRPPKQQATTAGIRLYKIGPLNLKHLNCHLLRRAGTCPFKNAHNN